MIDNKTANYLLPLPDASNNLSDDVLRLINALVAIDSQLALKAALASPAFTGTPTAPTAAALTNNTQIATTAFVRAAITALVDASPATLDTLNELAAALGDDPNFATTMTTALAGKVSKAGDVITGSLEAKNFLEGIYNIPDVDGFEINPSNGSTQTITLGASRTPKATNFANGASVALAVDDGTAYTLTWTDTTFGPSGVKWMNGTAPTLAITGLTWITLWKVGGQVYGASPGASS